MLKKEIVFRICCFDWEIGDELHKGQGIFTLGGTKLKIELLENNNLLSELSIDKSSTQNILHGIQIS